MRDHVGAGLGDKRESNESVYWKVGKFHSKTNTWEHCRNP